MNGSDRRLGAEPDGRGAVAALYGSLADAEQAIQDLNCGTRPTAKDLPTTSTCRSSPVNLPAVCPGGRPERRLSPN